MNVQDTVDYKITLQVEKALMKDPTIIPSHVILNAGEIKQLQEQMWSLTAPNKVTIETIYVMGFNLKVIENNEESCLVLFKFS